MDGYVWYSYGSDSTGQALAAALKAKSGKKTPNFSNYELVIGWGCKPGERYQPDVLGDLIGKRTIRVLNHVDAVHENRNKLMTFQKLQEAGVSIPGFVCNNEGENDLLKKVLTALEAGELDFPLLGLNEFHKGYPTFCYTIDDVVQDCGTRKGKGVSPIHYFRSFCPGTEFRVHVFRDEALSAEKKVLSDDPLQVFAQHLMKKMKSRAAKAEVKLRASQQEMVWIAEEVGQSLLSGPNHMQRSVTHGWSLQTTPLGEVPDQVLAQAIAAVDASGLDMGAVSVAWDDDVARVTGIISAPGLSEEQMGLYVSAIQEFAKTKKPKRSVARADPTSGEDDKAPRELIARLKRIIPGLSRKKAAEVLKTLEE